MGREGRHSTGSVIGEQGGGHGGDGGDPAGQLTGDAGGDPTTGREAGRGHPGRVDAQAPLEVVEQVGGEAQLVDPELDPPGAGPERPAVPVAGRDMDPVAAPLGAGGERRVGRHLQVP